MEFLDDKERPNTLVVDVDPESSEFWYQGRDGGKTKLEPVQQKGAPETKGIDIRSQFLVLRFVITKIN